MSSQRNTKSLNMYLSQKDNCPPPDHVIITPEEKISKKNKIFLNDNFTLVKEAIKLRKSKPNSISDRFQAIQDIHNKVF